MCGRYTMASPEEWIREEFDLQALPEGFRPRYNIAPTQDVLAVVEGPEGPRAGWLRWGLIPSWAKDESIGNKLINARSETLAEKPSFRAAFARRRCLLVADGFYEWMKADDTKVPMYVRRRSGRPFAFAGLWERWRSADGGSVVSCTIVTTQACDEIAHIHPRMPVILAPETRATWLDPHATPERLSALLGPYDAGDLEAYAVSTLVNSPANDVPECREPV